MLLPPPPKRKEKKLFFWVERKGLRVVGSFSPSLCGDVNGRGEKERGDIKRRGVEERERPRDALEIKTGLTFRRYIRI